MADPGFPLHIYQILTNWDFSQQTCVNEKNFVLNTLWQFVLFSTRRDELTEIFKVDSFFTHTTGNCAVLFVVGEFLKTKAHGKRNSEKQK